MTLTSTRFKVNSPPVIHQILDGEVIVVNLDTGTYYSLDGVGAEIWSAVEHGASVAETVDATAGRYGVPRTVVEPAVLRFVDELASEELIVSANGAPPPAQAGLLEGAATGAFAEPLLNRYTDMQELLLLDPIHDVDERGWPNSLDDGPRLGDA
jgi:hypothetical protein